MTNSFYQLISPKRAVLYAFIIYLICTLIPPTFYEQHIYEKNLMFLDVYAMLFVSGSIFSFIIGYYISNSMRKIRLSKIKIKRIIISKSLFFLIPMIVSIAILVFFIFDLINRNPLLLLLLFSYSGNEIKSSLETNPLFVIFLYFYMSILFWIFYNYLIQNFNILLKSLVFFMIFLMIVASTLLVARYILLPFLGSLFVLYIYSTRYKNNKYLYTRILIFIVSIFIIFSLFSLMRGGDIIYGLLGYGPASFNRLSGVLNGDIVFATPPLYYLLSSLKNNWSFYEIIVNEHDSISKAGLDGALNWVTMYGYLYYSLNYFALLYFLILGFISNITWKALFQNKIWAIVFYPWLFTSILLWFSYNILSYSQTFIIILSGIIIHFYNNIFKIKGVIQ
jgi:oligosaccharide repeat unit polymerase